MNFIEMFLDEARLAACIHHPNVGEVYELGEDNGVYFMVCELIPGQSLNDFAVRASERKIAISPVLYARVASATALALKAAHDLKSPGGESLQLVHRDVSTRNILISYDGYVKLIDFGVAYAEDKVSHTDTGALKGKVGYMSPEQVKSDPLDRRSDIFSLGVVLYRLITGRMPFRGRSEVDRLSKIINYQFTPPRMLVPDISAKLEKIILKAMAYEPADRYQSAAEMSDELDAYIAESDEPVDTDVLSRTMHLLFAEEREYHFARIRRVGPPSNWKQPPAGTYNLTKVMPVRPQPSTGADIESGASFNASSTDWTILAKRTAVIALGSLMVFAAFFFLVLRLGPFSDASGGPVTRGESNLNSGNVTLPIASLPEPDVAPDAADTEITISLVLSPADAKVELDNVTVPSGSTALKLSADGQAHQVTVSAEGYVAKSETIVADANRQLTISLLRKAAPEAEGQIGNSARRGRHHFDQTATIVNDTASFNQSDNQESALKKEKDTDDAGAQLLQASPYQ